MRDFPCESSTFSCSVSSSLSFEVRASLQLELVPHQTLASPRSCIRLPYFLRRSQYYIMVPRYSALLVIVFQLPVLVRWFFRCFGGSGATFKASTTDRLASWQQLSFFYVFLLPLHSVHCNCRDASFIREMLGSCYSLNFLPPFCHFFFAALFLFTSSSNYVDWARIFDVISGFMLVPSGSSLVTCMFCER